MNKYESIIILRPDYKEESKQEIIDKCKTLMKNIDEIEDIGIKKLAYEIKGNKEGYYIIFKDFEQTAEGIAEIERYYRLNETIIKFIVVRKDD